MLEQTELASSSVGKWFKYTLAERGGNATGSLSSIQKKTDLGKNNRKLILNYTICQLWGPPHLIQLDK